MAYMDRFFISIWKKEIPIMKFNRSVLTAVVGTAVGAAVAAGAVYLYRNHFEKKQPVPEQEPELTPEQLLAKEMPDLIHYDCFQLAVQPVIKLESGNIVGGEVLSRLKHPEQGIIFPNRFLPAIEEAGLSSRFDHYIFSKTCDLVKRMTTQQIQLSYLSCNFARSTLSEKNIVSDLCEIANSHGVPYNRLAVEVTEQELETNTDLFRKNLRELRDLGFNIFVDDLGAGVTAVRDLWTYPVDVMKLDRSLLQDAETEQGRVTFHGLQNLADNMGIKVLCEGVETEEQRQFVVDTGCDYGQGYLFYRPMEEQQFVRLVSKEA